MEVGWWLSKCLIVMRNSELFNMTLMTTRIEVVGGSKFLEIVIT